MAKRAKFVQIAVSETEKDFCWIALDETGIVWLFQMQDECPEHPGAKDHWCQVTGKRLQTDDRHLDRRRGNAQ